MIAPPRDENLTELLPSAASAVDPSTGIRDLIGALLANRPAWHTDALRQEHPEVDSFPGQGCDVRPAKRVCSECLVKAECRTWALEQGAELDDLVSGAGERKRRSHTPRPPGLDF